MMIKDSGARPGTSLAAQLLQTLAREALAACDPAAAMRRAVHVRPGHLSLCGRPISLAKKGRLIVTAFGKAAPAMTKGLLQRFHEGGGKRMLDALVIHLPDEPPVKGRKPATGPPTVLAAALQELHLPASRCRVKSFPGDHPVPLKNSFVAGKAGPRFSARGAGGGDPRGLASGGRPAPVASAPSRLPQQRG